MKLTHHLFSGESKKKNLNTSLEHGLCRKNRIKIIYGLSNILYKKKKGDNIINCFFFFFFPVGLVEEVAADWVAWAAKSVRWKKSEPSKTWQAKRWTWWSWWLPWTTGLTERWPSTCPIRLSRATRRRRGTRRRPGRTVTPPARR